MMLWIPSLRRVLGAGPGALRWAILTPGQAAIMALSPVDQIGLRALSSCSHEGVRVAAEFLPSMQQTPSDIEQE
jgi:hypothetical protein